MRDWSVTEGNLGKVFMHRYLFILSFLLGLASSAVAADVVVKEGDCWAYATRPGEESSFLVIRKIETLPKIGEVIHISIYGLKIPNSSAPHGYSDRRGEPDILRELDDAMNADETR
jgi:hypothetical protein